MKHSKTIEKAIRMYLTEDGWHYSFDKEDNVIRFKLSSKGRIKCLDYLIMILQDAYIVYAVCPIGADGNDQEAAAEMKDFVCRANCGIIDGGYFELDPDDMELRFKFFVACDDVKPTKAMIRRSICCPAAAFRMYSPGIIDVSLGLSHAPEAIDKCERLAVSNLISELREIIDEKDRARAADPGTDGTGDPVDGQPGMDGLASDADACLVHLRTNLFKT